MPAIDDFIAAMAAALERLQVIARRLSDARRAADDLAVEYRRLGSEDRVHDTTAIVEALEAQQSQVTVAAEHGKTVLARAEALRGGGDAVGKAGPSESSLRPVVASGTGPPPPLFVLDLADRLPGHEPGGRTRLFAYSHDDGVETEFASGRDRGAREGLKPEYARRFVVRDHAEGHVAAVMRRPDGPKEVTVVINNEPCPGPQGCDATLPHIIPRGTRMNVFLKQNGQVMPYATYEGTGKGIA